MKFVISSLQTVAATALFVLPASLVQVKAEEQPPVTQKIPETIGFYGTLGLGAAFPQDVTGSSSFSGVTVNGDYKLGGGFAAEAGVGYDFGPVRTELTYIFNNATLKIT